MAEFMRACKACALFDATDQNRLPIKSACQHCGEGAGDAVGVTVYRVVKRPPPQPRFWRTA